MEHFNLDTMRVVAASGTSESNRRAGSSEKVGCGIGLGPRRNLAMSLVLSMSFGFIIAIIIDLDQPRHGIIRASQTALTELRETLRPAP